MNKKQIGVIYRAFKAGKLQDVDKEDINNIYAYVDKIQYDYDFARKEGTEIIRYLKEAVDAIFESDYEAANKKLRNFKTVELF